MNKAHDVTAKRRGAESSSALGLFSGRQPVRSDQRPIMTCPDKGAISHSRSMVIQFDDSVNAIALYPSKSF